MGRTAESYLQESGTKPLNMLYPFAEWTDADLMEELGHDYTYKESMPHAPERLAQLERKIAHLCFEIKYRAGVFGNE